jgi:hypothetical protein
VISAATKARTEGYFRLEWRLADQRTHLMAKGRPFLLPVVIDATRDSEAHVPDSFTEVQWTRLNGDMALAAFATHIAASLKRWLNVLFSWCDAFCIALSVIRSLRSALRPGRTAALRHDFRLQRPYFRQQGIAFRRDHRPHLTALRAGRDTPGPALASESDLNLVGNANARLRRRKILGVSRHQQTALAPRRRPYDGVGQPNSDFFSDLNGFARDLQRKVMDGETIQESLAGFLFLR